MLGVSPVLSSSSRRANSNFTKLRKIIQFWPALSLTPPSNYNSESDERPQKKKKSSFSHIWSVLVISLSGFKGFLTAFLPKYWIIDHHHARQGQCVGRELSKSQLSLLHYFPEQPHNFQTINHGATYEK